MLVAEGIGKRFGATVALSGVGFTANAGEVLAIVGENGSGKSTLMRILKGELLPDSGTVKLEGLPVAPNDPRVLLVHQELAQCPHLTAAENIFLGLERGFGFSPKRRTQEAQRILNDLGFDHISAGALAGSLPVSSRQVLEIARCIAQNAPLVLLDEPTSSLTSEEKSKLFRLINRLKTEGRLVVYISHFLEEVREVSDQVLILRDGERILQQSTASLTDEEIVSAMVGRTISEVFPRSQRGHAPDSGNAPSVVLESLSRNDGRLKGVSLQAFPGEVLGIAGLQGSGRTELLRAIMGLDRVASGSVKVKGKAVMNPTASWKQHIGFVSEERKVDGVHLDLSLTENVHLPSRKGVVVKDRIEESSADEWLKRLSTKYAGPQSRVRELSGGNQQKVAFARLLHADCDVFLLDEPTRGIDIGSKTDLYREIDRVANEGKTVLMAGSYLPELLGVCDRIAVLSRGTLVSVQRAAEATPESILKDCLA